MSDCEDVPAAILSETDRVLPGEGVAEIDGLLDALREGGYCGPVSLKIPSPKLLGLDAAEAAKVVLTVSEPYLDGAPAGKETQT
jgi:sugar phosphate isomerase/epimerase